MTYSPSLVNRDPIFQNILHWVSHKLTSFRKRYDKVLLIFRLHQSETSEMWMYLMILMILNCIVQTHHLYLWEQHSELFTIVQHLLRLLMRVYPWFWNPALWYKLYLHFEQAGPMITSTFWSLPRSYAVMIDNPSSHPVSNQDIFTAWKVKDTNVNITIFKIEIKQFNIDYVQIKYEELTLREYLVMW